MTLDITTRRTPQLPPAGHRSRWRERRQDRQRLAAEDRRAAHLAELHHIRALVADAHTVIAAGWVQHGWFTYRDDHGRNRTVTAQNLKWIADRPATGACLVGAIVQAGGGVAAEHTQPVRRALDLTWRTLYGDEREPIDRCPAPPVRAARVRELTCWNDHPDRTRAEVTALLCRVGQAAGAEIERLRV